MPKCIVLDYERLNEHILKELMTTGWRETEWAIGDVYGCQVSIRIRVADEDTEPADPCLVCLREAKVRPASKKKT